LPKIAREIRRKNNSTETKPPPAFEKMAIKVKLFLLSL
jgi:hypothetical protein